MQNKCPAQEVEQKKTLAHTHNDWGDFCDIICFFPGFYDENEKGKNVFETNRIEMKKKEMKE